MTLTRQQLILDLYIAFGDASRRKSKMSYVRRFEENLKANIESLADDILSRTYKALPSRCFIVDRPKKREVFAAQFRDRVVHHLYFNYTHELFERTFIQDCYSCIKGRGTLYGSMRLYDHIRAESQNWTKRCYVMKMDIRGYFMHINRQRLCDIAIDSIRKMSSHQIDRHSKTTWADKLDMPMVEWLTREIITMNPKDNCERVMDKSLWDGLDPAKSLFCCEDGLGLPIGNLTSQLFSNVYLNIFDQYMKRDMGCKHYGRYVDDAYVVSCDKERLLSLAKNARAFLSDKLGSELHMGKLSVSNVRHGVEFLGVFVKPYRLYPAKGTIGRMRSSLNKLKDEIESGAITNDKACRTINSYLGLLKHTSSYNIRKCLFFRMPFVSVGIFDRDFNKIINV